MRFRPTIHDALVHDQGTKKALNLIVGALNSIGLVAIDKTKAMHDTHPRVQVLHDLVVELGTRICNDGVEETIMQMNKKIA